MSRLNKQCIFASAGLHLLLLIALIFGAGFLPDKPEKKDIEPFHMMPASVIESLFDDPADIQGEAQPEPEPDPIVDPVEPPPVVEETPSEPEPEPIVEPEPEPVKPEPVKPEPVKEVVKEPIKELPKENAISKKEEPENKWKPKPVTISLKTKKNTAKPTVKNTPVKSTIRPRSKPAAKFDPSNINRVGKGSTIKGVTTVLGSTLGNYGRKVQAAYDRQWTQYTNVSKRNATVRVSVVVGTDGSITSAKVVKSSGIAALDRSIERVIDLVTRIPEPPPSGASLSDRTFTLNFNIK